MVVDTNKESVCVNQIVGQKSTKLVVDGDVIVPDIKPDILSAVKVSGNVCIYKKEVLDGKIRVDGCIQTYIMYIADNATGELRGINTSLDFTQMIDLENCQAGMNLTSNLTINSMEANVLNGRKLAIKAVLDANFKVYSNSNIDIVKEINSNCNLQKLSNTIEVNSLVGSGTIKTYAKETASIDPIDNLAEILKVDINIGNKDIKISYNKILAKADARVKIMYLTEDNRVNIVESNIPVMGFIDIPNISEQNSCDTEYELKNIVIKPNSEEEHSIYIEAEIEISCSAFERKTIEVIEDMYGLNEKLTFSKKQANTMCNKNTYQDILTMKERIPAPEIMGNKIYDTAVTPHINEQKILADRIMYDGEITISMLFATETTNQINTKIVNLPFNFSINAPEVNSSSSIDLKIDVINQNFVVMQDGYIDTQIDMNFLINVANFRSINLIDDVEIQEIEEEDLYSMVVYFVKPGDTLWSIAKKFRSTVEDIARVNEIDNPNILQVSRQLFIPRFSKKKSA